MSQAGEAGVEGADTGAWLMLARGGFFELPDLLCTRDREVTPKRLPKQRCE